MINTRLSALFCLSFLAWGADVTVHVADPQDRAIPSASVSLTSRDGERRTQTTDAKGLCRFADIPPGQYWVQGEASGFDAAAPRALQLMSETSAEVALALGLAEVRSSVVVTASGTPQTADEVSKALSVVDADTMTLRSDKSVGDAADGVPGLHVQQLGGPGSTTYFKVRGLRNTDTAVLIDGLRLRDAAGTQADASGVLQDLVLADTSRIEVLRGTGSSLYGTDATGGVVNIVTDEGGGRTRGSLLVDGGSLGSVRGVARLAGGLLNDRLQYSLGVTHWNVMSGVDGDAPARNTTAQGRAALRLSRIITLSTRIYFGDSFSFVRTSPRAVGTLPPAGIIDAVPASLPEEHRYESGTPLPQLVLGGATFLPATLNPDSTRAGRFFTGAFRLDVRPSERLGFSAQYQELSTTRDYGDGPAGSGSQPKGNNLSDYLGHIRTANARLDVALGRFQQIDGGYEFEYEDFQNQLAPPAPTPQVFTDVSQSSHAVFAQDQLRFFDGRLLIAAGYRVQVFELDRPFFEPSQGAPFAGRFSAPPAAQTGDVSAAWMMRRTGTKIRAHAGRGYRAPSLYERFGVFFNGAGYTLYGDPGLRPDRSASIDGGIDQMLWNSRIQLAASYFYTKLNEVIIFDTSGAITPLTDPLGRNGGYRNTGGGLARGVESAVTVVATRSLQFNASYTFTDARQRTPLVAGVWQTYEVPSQQYSAFLTERLTSRIEAYLGYSGASPYLASVSGRAFRFDGPSRMRAGLSYRRPLAESRSLRFYVRADNLFNQAYFENGFRTPGMTFTTGTQVEF